MTWGNNLYSDVVEKRCWTSEFIYLVLDGFKKKKKTHWNLEVKGLGIVYIWSYYVIFSFILRMRLLAPYLLLQLTQLLVLNGILLIVGCLLEKYHFNIIYLNNYNQRLVVGYAIKYILCPLCIKESKWTFHLKIVRRPMFLSKYTNIFKEDFLIFLLATREDICHCKYFFFSSHRVVIYP